MKRLLLLAALTALYILNASAMPVTLGVTVAGTKSERGSSFVITNTGTLTTTFVIGRKTETNVLGNPNPPTGFPPRLEITYKLNGKPFVKLPGQIQLEPNQTATVTMKARVVGAQPLAYTRTLKTTVTASSASYVLPTARIPKTQVDIPPVKASDSVSIIIKRGSR